ncbi:metallopeptidase family M24 [Apiospora phragmitis]|uniref:Probable Xaa-Pro aminopeptidase P n=1 Tax=Apiospora phragmitis TaxID=2905665 RepID=A0ABR1UI25_9PEZI
MRLLRPLTLLSRSLLRPAAPPLSRAYYPKCPSLRRDPSVLANPSNRRYRTYTTAVDMEKVDTTSRLAALRKFMKEHNVDVYIVPSEDSHSSEYIAACDARRAFISGFIGSAGCAVITHDKAALATDGRYFNQASKQLDDNWTLLKQGIENSVAVDPTLLTAGIAKKLSDKIKKEGGKELVPIQGNLVDQVWASERPSRPSEPVFILEDKHAGRDVKAKLAELRKEIEKKKAFGFVVSMLDEVAWLFNLRGSDIPYNPVFFSYAVVTPEDTTLYFDSSKLDQKYQAVLAEFGVTIKPYDAVFEEVTSLGQKGQQTNSAKTGESRKFLISNKASWALKRALGGDEMVEEMRSPISDSKAVKNEAELEGMRACHVRDGAALIEYFAWLEHELIAKKSTLDEVDAADKLEALRKKQEHYIGLSFDTISSTGANAAVIHYKPEKGACATIDPNAIYLCDSGAQYLDGTTDTTRTLHFGTPTAEEIEAYTLVLKGNIALDKAVFPKGTTGFALDCLARQHLWNLGLDYRHGTGHGVGSFLNVHEGPIGIGTRVQFAEVALAPGNVISNEPGFYKDESFGIRIENIIMVKEVKTKHSFGDKPWLGFEHVTMVPYCRKLIDTSLLTEGEIAWLNAYNAEIWDQTHGFFKDEIVLNWLQRETGPY